MIKISKLVFFRYLYHLKYIHILLSEVYLDVREKIGIWLPYYQMDG